MEAFQAIARNDLEAADDCTKAVFSYEAGDTGPWATRRRPQKGVAKNRPVRLARVGRLS